MKTSSFAILGPSTRFLSGISYFTIRLANALSSDIDVSVILFRKMLPQKLFPGSKRVGKDLVAKKFNPSVKEYEILDWYNPITWVEAYNIIRKKDFIIFQWWTSSVAHMYLFILLLNVHKKITVIEFHEVVDPFENSILPLKGYSRIIGKLIVRYSTAYVTHSLTDKELIAKKFKIKPGKIFIIPHGLYDQYNKIPKDEARKLLGISEENVILFFGLIRPYKGLKFLIEAFEQLSPTLLVQSRLLIVGEAWEDIEAVNRARKSKFSEKITIINRYVSDDEVSLFFSASDILVIPYTRASQSGVAHIGMAFGMPIIASRVGGLVEGLGSYKGTFFVNAGEKNEITGKIVECIKNRKIYTVPEDLDWNTVADKWNELYLELVQSGRYIPKNHGEEHHE